jgi:hypothetical protein
MKPAKLVRALLRVLALLAVLAAFAVLDWVPTLKDLNRLRRERGDLERKIRDYRTASAAFLFPDAGEEERLASCKAELLLALPNAESDDAWTALALVEIDSFLQRDRIPHARSIPIAPGLLSGDHGMRPIGSDPLDSWSRARPAGIAAGFAMAGSQGHFPWYGVFAGLSLHSGRPASRALGLALAAPLPALLDFVNHVSWGEVRLEIVRLNLEPGIPLSRAWLVFRGIYRTGAASTWPVAPTADEAGEPLVDPDSPLLLQRVDPLWVPRAEKRELPPSGSPW